MRSKLCDAVQNQQVVEFQYRGRHRVVEPHKVGRTTKGNVVLSGFQSGGSGNEINPPDWGLYKLNKISSLKISGGTFSGPRSGYKRSDKRMTQIYCRL
jgi:predicted DNA-binding transcriptional regulator YafY